VLNSRQISVSSMTRVVALLSFFSTLPVADMRPRRVFDGLTATIFAVFSLIPFP
jgi:hypothetical protein